MQKTVTLADSMDGLATIVYDNKASFCKLNGPSARLTLLWEQEYNDTIEEPNQRTMSFSFSAVSSSSSGGLTCFCVTYDIMYT